MKPFGRKTYWSGYRRLKANPKLVDATRQALDLAVAEKSAEFENIMGDALLGSLNEHKRRGQLPQHLHEVADAASMEELALAWSQVPKTTRADLHASESSFTHKRGDTLVRTGGSTGEPVGVFVSLQGFRSKRSRLLAAREAIGWLAGMPTFVLWGSQQDIGKPESLMSTVHYHLSGFDMSAGFKTDETRWLRLAERMERQASQIAIYGYTSLLSDFSATLLKHGRRLRPGLVRTVWNGAEPLDPRSRDDIELATNSKVHDFYGTRETGALAVELPSAADRELTVLGPHVLLEVVDDQDLTVPEGVTGRLLVSLLNGSGTPLYRYEIGDFAVAGRPHALGHLSLATVVGRTNDVIPLPDGRTVGGNVFNHALKDFPVVRQFQAQVNVARLEVNLRVQAERSLTDEEVEALCRVVSYALDGYSTRVSQVESFTHTDHGKLRHVVVQ